MRFLPMVIIDVCSWICCSDQKTSTMTMDKNRMCHIRFSATITLPE